GVLVEDAGSGEGESFPVTVNAVEGGSAVNTVTIKPAPGASPAVTGVSGTALLVLNGADYVTVDGSNQTGGATRDLTLTNTSGSGAAAAVRGQPAGSDGASRDVGKKLT